MADVVLDASVTAKWFLGGEEHGDHAESLRIEILEQRLTLVVPGFWAYETASVLSKAVANRRLDESRAQRVLDEAMAVPRIAVELPDPTEAFYLARRFNRSVIDCFYLAIAEERGCDFWSDDRKLCRALTPTYPFVRWIGDYAAPAPAPVE